MGQITVEKNAAGIEGLCVITPAVHGDSRGYFMETYSQRDMEEASQRTGCGSGPSRSAPAPFWSSWTPALEIRPSLRKFSPV